MMNYLMLLTNDNGIESPDLHAAVETGNVTVVAASHQQTAAGLRSNR